MIIIIAMDGLACSCIIDSIAGSGCGESSDDGSTTQI